jgi:hypothetical protein
MEASADDEDAVKGRFGRRVQGYWPQVKALADCRLIATKLLFASRLFDGRFGSIVLI